MEFYDVVKSRRSIRAYLDKPVEEEKLTRVRNAVRQAPTACNRQPFRFLELRGGAAKEAVLSCYSRDWLRTAPMLMVAVGLPRQAWSRFNGKSIYEVDVAIAMEHLVLSAAAEGLGTCWICAFDQEALREALSLSETEIPVAITPLGYAAKEPDAVPRKPVNELFEVVTS
ncbi:MAG: nitroreductase family protein [Verrucomicrobiota bacterium]